jgi:hypothetical protein
LGNWKNLASCMKNIEADYWTRDHLRRRMEETVIKFGKEILKMIHQ